MCETPKSPPGDYNIHLIPLESSSSLRSRVKHLNPRQGITTRQPRPSRKTRLDLPCETPKSPPGDYNTRSRSSTVCAASTRSVKHLNPRQGITTECFHGAQRDEESPSVKHLNPRQGITTRASSRRCVDVGQCGVKHLNPRQGITTS